MFLNSYSLCGIYSTRNVQFEPIIRYSFRNVFCFFFFFFFFRNPIALGLKEIKNFDGSDLRPPWWGYILINYLYHVELLLLLSVFPLIIFLGPGPTSVGYPEIPKIALHRYIVTVGHKG